MDLTTRSELGGFSLKKIPLEDVKHCINIVSVEKEQNEAKTERGGDVKIPWDMRGGAAAS